jgi:hypothetical protein
VRLASGGAKDGDLVETRPFGTGRHSPVRARIPVHIAAAARELRRRPSPAAIHEAAHVLVARRYGCDVHGAFVDRDGRNGRTYFDAPRTRFENGRLLRDPLGRIRALSAVSMAATIAERIAAGQPIEGHEELLLTETLDPAEAKYFDNLIERLWTEASVAFRHNHHDGATWLEAMLVGVRRQVIELLRERWPELISLARELDRARAKGARAA